MVKKAYGFVLRQGADGQELLVFEHAGMPEAGLQVPGGTVEEGETPLEAVAREVLEESGLPLGDWLEAAAFDHDGDRWHCFATTPPLVLPDTWRCEPLGPEREQGLRFEYRWVPLVGGEALAGGQELARVAVIAFAAGA